MCLTLPTSRQVLPVHQMMGFLGSNVIKIERRGSGDMTRGWLQDKPNVDSLYFTMFNCNKRSIELDMKTPEGKELLEQMIKKADVMVENFGPGALDRMGFTWEYIQELNPRVILASVKGYAEGHANEHLKVYENVAQCSRRCCATPVSGWCLQPFPALLWVTPTPVCT